MTNTFGGVSSGELRQFVERIEKLEEEKAQVSELVREVYAEAKSEGFDVKVMRQVVKLRKMKREDMAEQEELLDLYKHALGMIPSSTANDNEGVERAAG